MLRAISIPMLRRRRDARQVDSSVVATLAESIKEVGILNPLCVRARQISVNGEVADGFEIIAGAHRYEAACRAGLDAVPCIVVEHDDLHAELAMIDENLCRAELTPSDRAETTARRKRIYEELHPETRHGENQHTRSRQLGDSSEADRFTASTAAKTGKPERTIQRDAERGERICSGAIALLRGTFLDKGAYLDKIKLLPIDEQIERVRSDLLQGERTARRAATGVLPIEKTADDVEFDQKKSLLSAWNRASLPVRQWFKEQIADEAIMNARFGDIARSAERYSGQ